MMIWIETVFRVNPLGIEGDLESKSPVLFRLASALNRRIEFQNPATKEPSLSH